MILVDSNIPMYLVGAAHPNKEAARRALEEAVAAGESLSTDAEVLQEILHRYTAIRRPEEIDPAFDALLAIVDVVYPIERADVERARRLLATTPTLSARDAVHLAVMQARDVGRILTFDVGFDGIPGVVRLT
ncbi:MAG: type II toxin-antitoxin system VapC family toxin [Candidatus Limnocylindrales bacterium]